MTKAPVEPPCSTCELNSVYEECLRFGLECPLKGLHACRIVRNLQEIKCKITLTIEEPFEEEYLILGKDTTE
jgi:hypothetical protein